MSRYLVFASLIVGATAALIGIGYLPTRSTVGAAGVQAMLAACVVCALASLLGGLPIALARQGALEGARLFMISMMLRILFTALLATAAGLGLGLEIGPFLVWLAIGYLALLVVDTGYAWLTLSRLSSPGRALPSGPGKKI